MDFLRRLDPGRASAAAAARPALPSLMAALPVSSLAPLSSRLASSHTHPTGAAPEATGAWPEGLATPTHEVPLPPRQAASRAPFDAADRGPVQAAAATPVPQANRVPERLRPLPQAALSGAAQSAEALLRAPRAKPSGVPRQAFEPAPSLAPRRAASVAPWRHSGPPQAGPAHPLSAAALQAHASASPTVIAAPAPALHVTIDRIEVRAAVAALKPAPAQRQPKPPVVSLADYLRAGARSKAAP